MRLLFLRGQVPRDRDPAQIMFESLSECDDSWTHIASNLIGADYGEIWYWGGNRVVHYNDKFTERWVEDFQDNSFDFNPDVIIARGGFEEYEQVLGRFSKAFKVYYGAGRRFVPKKPENYNLLLVDDPRQQKFAKESYPELSCELFIKPAADNIFYPEVKDKTIDILFVGSESQRKMLRPLLDLKLQNKYTVAVSGIISDNTKREFKKVKFFGWQPRKDMRNVYNSSKITVCCSNELDSNPRVISESLACGVPIVVLDSVMLWEEKYINKDTGVVSKWDRLDKDIVNLVKEYQSHYAYDYYKNNLSMNVSVEYLKGLICARY